MRFLFLILVVSKLYATQPENQADLITFSYNRPMQLYALLESVEMRTSNFRNIAVICRVDPLYEAGYEIVMKRFPYVHFMRQNTANPQTDFKPILMELLFGKFGKEAKYVVFAVDDIILTVELDVREGIRKLQETQAYGLYYRLGPSVNYSYMLNRYQRVPAFVDAGNGYLSWRFDQSEYDWAYPNTVDFTLYPKEVLKIAFDQFEFANPSELEGTWAGMPTHNPLGICCTRTKMINIPLNIVAKVGWMNRATHRYSAEELNRLFLTGLKIDIHKFYHDMNNSAHVDYIPDFIER